MNQEEIPYNDKKDRLNLNLADICGSFFLVLLLLANTRRDLLEESPLRLHSYFSILPELVMLLFVCLGFFFFWSCFVCQKYIFLYCLHFPWSHSPYGTLWYLMRIFLRTWNFKVFRENCGKKKKLFCFLHLFWRGILQINKLCEHVWCSYTLLGWALEWFIALSNTYILGFFPPLLFKKNSSSSCPRLTMAENESLLKPQRRHQLISIAHSTLWRGL